MAKLKLKVIKVKNVNLQTKKEGRVARVLTNGTADYSQIAEDAAEDTTFNVDEIRAAAGIFCRAAAKMLKQGYIVDLGPLGKIYPSCSSGRGPDARKREAHHLLPPLRGRAHRHPRRLPRLGQGRRCRR